MSETQTFVLDYELPQSLRKCGASSPSRRSSLNGSWKTTCVQTWAKFTFRPRPTPWWDGVVHREVLEVDPERRLRYSWRGGSAEQRLDTMVTWTLTPSKSGGTLLRLEHAGFTDKDKFAYQGMSEGWRGKVGQRLREMLATLD